MCVCREWMTASPYSCAGRVIGAAGASSHDDAHTHTHGGLSSHPPCCYVGQSNASFVYTSSPQATNRRRSPWRRSTGWMASRRACPARSAPWRSTTSCSSCSCRTRRGGSPARWADGFLPFTRHRPSHELSKIWTLWQKSSFFCSSVESRDSFCWDNNRLPC